MALKGFLGTVRFFIAPLQELFIIVQEQDAPLQKRFLFTVDGEK